MEMYFVPLSLYCYENIGPLSSSVCLSPEKQDVSHYEKDTVARQYTKMEAKHTICFINSSNSQLIDQSRVIREYIRIGVLVLS